MADQALTGIKVLDLSTTPGGNYCCKLLADYGADVIKVEKPGRGDPVRWEWPFKDDIPGPERSGFFFYLNTNKNSVTLNLETASGAHILKQLVKDADALVESFPPGTLDKMGLGYEELKKVNRRLVMASITPFGATGPYRDYKGPDIVTQSLSGALYGWGEAGRESIKAPGYPSDLYASAGAAVCTLAALWDAQETGEGQWIDVGALETQTLMTNIFVLMYVYTGMIIPKNDPPFPNVMRCKDGFIGINLLTQWHWESLCKMLGTEELLSDATLATPGLRGTQAQRLYEIFQPLLLEYTAEELFNKAAGEMQLPLGLIPNPKQVLELEQHLARGFIIELEHPVLGKVKMPGAPCKLEGTPAQYRSGAPLLGQHNQEVYGRLGYSKEDLVRLAQRGIV